MSIAPINPDKAAKKEKKKKKNGGVKITPEYIEEQRRLAQIRKQQKALEKQQNGQEQPIEEAKNAQFIKRPILWLDDSPSENVTLKIMTYNLLAQSLIRRSLFPTSGEALKWNNRSAVLLQEIQFYNPDIMCLQEVDAIQFQSFWKLEFEKMGYHHEYYRYGKKNHGVAIIYSKKYFQKSSTIKYINYDDVESYPVQARTKTTNVGLVMKLDFNEGVKCGRQGMVIGTHHLFWHPHGTFERTRQTYATLKMFLEFLNDQNLKAEDYYHFFCGDFNAEPYHSPYLSMTRKPVYYDDVAKSVIEESVTQIFSDGPDKAPEEPVDDPDKPKYTAAAIGAPKGVPTTSSGTVNAELIKNLIKIHNELPMRAISLYSVGYQAVHPENSTYRNEPDFSNWAHTWRGLLDYIFVISPWDITSTKHDVDTVQELQVNEGIKLKGLLRMPPRSEMPDEGLPRTGDYGSDHLCMVGVVELV
ncbi:RNA exonuclease [Saccharomycopsis crataegensis]|uniref:RNA exonuclease n=1 Tax=Saccharomycopsis crataegensis TaxID=43959 RepID=A0AAV5QPH7_9ASCO|nr:RNA exonuclease [Saccharomycopsis crataegensis]